MRIIYSLAIFGYSLLTWVSSVFLPKARIMIRGRRRCLKMIRSSDFGDRKRVWVHCASLGEFEQGRPVIELIREKHPATAIIVTFFSPSGYEVRKDWDGADLVLYLPADLPLIANRFISTLDPDIAIFVKYEFWYNMLFELQKRRIPIYLVSGIFRKDQLFFRWWGRWFRKILGGFKMLFIQDQDSSDLLGTIGIDNCQVCGDTRFDRVNAISKSATVNQVIDDFRRDSRIVLAGSSWPPDEEIIAKYIKEFNNDVKWVFAPHEVNAANINRLEELLGEGVIRYSQAGSVNLAESSIMIIDNIGLLSSAYRYASVAVIGGGFGKGIHNILEPATWGIPVMFGPSHTKFSEAAGLLKEGGAFAYHDFDSFSILMDHLLTDPNFLASAGNCSARFVEKNLGATEKIVSGIFPK